MAKDGIVNIKGRDYKTVALRVSEFRDKYPISKGWAILTELRSCDGNGVVVTARIVNPEGVPVASGSAQETWTGQINSTSAVENCETSAIGRALAAAGLGGSEFASADEVARAIGLQQQGHTNRPVEAPVSPPVTPPVAPALPTAPNMAATAPPAQPASEPAKTLVKRLPKGYASWTPVQWCGYLNTRQLDDGRMLPALQAAAVQRETVTPEQWELTCSAFAKNAKLMADGAERQAVAAELTKQRQYLDNLKTHQLAA